MEEVKPNWSNDFKNWLVDLCELSIESSFGVFKEEWYKALNGISTGSSISVQLANITVYYVLRKVLYRDEDLMKWVVGNGIKRFIDDGTGLFSGSLNDFDTFNNKVSSELENYGLIIKKEEWKIASSFSDSVNFLDIRYWFDGEGELQTDLYVKPTDARSYLNFNSCHPGHIFPGIVYTQALRVRRIVNNLDRLTTHLNNLKHDFIKAQYPTRMVNNIINKVLTLPRIINNTKKQEANTLNTNDNNKIHIKVISTYGRDKPLTNIVNTIPNKDKFKFNHIKRAAPSLNSILCRKKYPSLGPKFGPSERCRKNRCKCCKLMSEKEVASIANKCKRRKIHTGAGKCTTRNVIYLALCRCCCKYYVGKTTQQLNGRTNHHRACFVKYVKSNGKLKVAKEKLDNYAMGIHLFNEHDIKLEKSFDEAYELYILEICSPKILDVKEHMWIHKLKALAPHGLNLGQTYGFPLLS